MKNIFNNKKEIIEIRKDLLEKIGKIEIEIKDNNLYLMKECELYIDGVNWGEASIGYDIITTTNREFLKKYKINGDSLKIRLLDDINKIRKIQKEYKEFLKQEFFDRKIKIITAIVGCDWPERVLAFKDYDFEVYYKFLLEEIGDWAYEAENWLPKEIPFKDGLDITDVFWQEYIRRKEMKEIKEKEREEKIKKLKEIAKKKNKKQILHQYSVDCNGEVDDCSIDNIIIYVYPNGEIKEERIHCY